MKPQPAAVAVIHDALLIPDEFVEIVQPLNGIDPESEHILLEAVRSVGWQTKFRRWQQDTGGEQSDRIFDSDPSPPTAVNVTISYGAISIITRRSQLLSDPGAKLDDYL